MTKPVKQRFYVDLDYDPKAVPKKELRAIIMQAIVAELPDVARDYQTKITGLTITYEPRQVRAQRQAMKNADVRNKRWINTY